MSLIKPKKLKTKDIKDSILKYAKQNNISPEKCTFIINEVITYIKTSLDDNFKLFNEDVNEHYKEKNKLLNEHVKFKQVYIITVAKKTNTKIKLHHSIDFGEFSTHPKIIIDPDSTIPYKTYKPKDLFRLLVSEVNKIKAYNGILINIFDTPMIKNLKVFTQHIYAGKFVKRVKIPLFDGVEPETTKESKLIMWFEQKESTHKIIEVEEGEILVEYRKPKYGKNGFNAFGQQLDSEVGSNKEGFKGEIDNASIDIIESEDKILYKSKLKGFVHFTNNNLKVDNRLRMSKLSRVEDSLAKDEENNVEVIISQHDSAEDSVGEGVKLTSETIHVTGFVGSKSVLEAINMKIDGATHQDSTQFARFAQINRHKGTLRCHDAKIKLLEGGEVHATHVTIESAVGGTIYAQDVTIGYVKSNVKVHASNSITLKLVSGEDNLFKINYKEIPILRSKIDFIDKDIEELQYSLEGAARHNKEQVPIIKEKIKDLKNIQKNIMNSFKKAKITIEKPLHGLNIINFSIPNGSELVYKTDAKKYEPFSLEIKEDCITLLPVKKSISI